MKRWLWILVLAALAGAGIFLGFRPQPVAVEAGKVSIGPLRLTVEEEGKTRLRSRYLVYAPVAGYTPRLPWKAGDVVQAGQTITQLEPPSPVVLDARSKDQASARVKATEALLAVSVARVHTFEEQARVARADLASVVAPHHHEPVAVEGNAQGNPVGVGMARGIREGLLDDPVDDHLGVAGDQRVDVGDRRRDGVSIPAAVVGQPAQTGGQPELVQDGRPQVTRQPCGGINPR